MRSSYFIRRTWQAFALLLLATVVIFMLIHLAPGDPARLMLGDQASQENVDALRHNLGLDKPLWVQYWQYIRHLATGNLGTSIRAQRPVLSLIGETLPHTLLLVGAALATALLIGLPVGIAGALRPRTFGWLAQSLSSFGQSVPDFLLGLVLIFVFSVRWGLFPTSGYGGVDHLVLPTLALMPLLLALVVRVTRQGVQAVNYEDYVRTAYAKGLPLRVIVPTHILKNALPPVLTVVAIYAAGMVGGAVVVEVLFAWPGIGQLAVDSIVERDYPVVQGVALIAVMVFIATNFVVDLLYVVLDPRTRLES